MSKTKTLKKIEHHKKHQAKKHAKVYWPYLPLMFILAGSMLLTLLQPVNRHLPATLAYATEMSRSGLLASTNSERNAVGATSLILNDKLNAAAQAKANDMVARDYWSHNTPDGQEPWVFIDAQGYEYTKAGENLAYGFSSSGATITGWMNSPSHKANMLDVTFSEVGFGYTNSTNFVSTGEQTIVVAMYGKPIVPVPAPAPPPPASTNSQQVAQASTKPPAPAPTPVSEPIVNETPPVPTPTEEIKLEVTQSGPVNTDSVASTLQDTPERITLLQQLTKGHAPWSAFALSLFGFALATIWLIKHGFAVKRFISEGEYFVAHHPILDLVVVTVIAIILYLSQNSGVIL